jgi:hypothetical protein
LKKTLGQVKSVPSILLNLKVQWHHIGTVERSSQRDITKNAIGGPLKDSTGLSIFVPADLDTDLLGTFLDKFECEGTSGEVVVRKARFGIAAPEVTYGSRAKAASVPTVNFHAASAAMSS